MTGDQDVVRTALAIRDDVRSRRQLLQQLAWGCQDEPERMARVIVTLAEMIPADDNVLLLTPRRVYSLRRRGDITPKPIHIHHPAPPDPDNDGGDIGAQIASAAADAVARNQQRRDQE